MMTLQQIKTALRDRNLAYVARAIGVTRQHLWQIANGITSPSVEVLGRISDYLEGRTDDKPA